MNKTQIRGTLLLLLTAIIWGVAFVAQSEGGDAIGAFSFNGLRSILGSAVLLPVIFFLDKLQLTSRRPETRDHWKILWKSGLFCGLAMFVASNFQQVGINLGTPVGKAGFLTACYILIVPILGIFLKKKCGWNIWVGVAITLVGLYLLCMDGSLRFQFSDLLILLCAVCFSFHILLVDHFSPLVDGVRLSCIQFLVSGVLSLLVAFFFEMNGSLSGIKELGQAMLLPGAWISLLYAGVMSCGIAYTLQIIGQNGMNPTVASLLMSLESVFSVIAGWIILKEALNAKELLGCGLIFVAIVLAQLPVGESKGD